MEILLRIAAVMAEAQRLVAHTAASDENIQAAKLTAEGVIKTLYADVGWQVGVVGQQLPACPLPLKQRGNIMRPDTTATRS